MFRKSLVVTIAFLSLLATSCVKEAGFEERVRDIAKADSLESGVATIEKQAEQLAASLKTLTDEHNVLAEFIAELEQRVADMEQTLSTVEERLAELKAGTEGKLDDQETAIVGMLEAYRTELQGEIDDLNALIESFGEKDKELEKKIDNLKIYADTQLDSEKDWLNITFATLEQKDSIAKVTAAIEVYAKKVNVRIDSLAKVHREDSTSIYTAIDALDSKTAAALAKAVHNMDSVIKKTAGDITVAYKSELAKAIDNSAASVRKWVNDTLNSYYTVSAFDAEMELITADIKSLEGKMHKTDSTLDALGKTVNGHTMQIKRLQDSVRTAYGHIATVRDSLKLLDNKIDTTKAAITVAYKEAISDSLGVLRVVMTDSLKAVNDRVSALASRMTAVEGRVTVLEGEMSDVQDSITTLFAAVAGLRTDVDKLLSRIQSIEVVPMYADGSVDIATGVNEIKFDFRPASVAEALIKQRIADMHKIFSFQMVGRNAGPSTNAPSFTKINFNGVHFDVEDSLVVLNFFGAGMPSGFYDETVALSGVLRLNDGNTDISSGYFAVQPLFPANCYMSTSGGTSSFKAVKGNSSISVGDVKSVKVLWESFGTDTPPSAGAIVSEVKYANEWITYTTTGTEGNAVIAAYDGENGNGNILWSWHIWCTDQPAEQVYNNNAGTMMDRNLGATDATKGSVGSFGLMYQWGRKDPFLGAATTKAGSSEKAASTLSSWPTPVVAKDNSDNHDLNLMVSIQNPTTFIYMLEKADPNRQTLDWFCTQNSWVNRDDSLWKDTKKGMYDPCPDGWRVADGGSGVGIWTRAFGQSQFSDTTKYDGGYDFGVTEPRLVDLGSCWYPSCGYLDYTSANAGVLTDVSGGGYYWSSAPLEGEYDVPAYLMYICKSRIYTSQGGGRARGRSVRCMKDE